jgi:hypothetical protein
MEINGPETPAAMRLFETLQRSNGFKCACCETIYGKPEEAAYVTAYKPRTTMMKERVPEQNAAAYVVCIECARLPEKTVFIRAEQYLIQHGALLQTGHKPIDKPGRHGKKGLITQGTRFKLN